MKKVIYTKGEQKVPLKLWTDQIDQNTIDQGIQATNHPAIFHHLSIMADGHWCRGISVGSVFPTKGAIVPGAVGSDIGCGLTAWNSGIKVSNIDVHTLMVAVKENIPHGKSSRKEDDAWLPIFSSRSQELEKKLNEICLQFPKLKINWESRDILQIGTLGDSNHFFSCDIDADNNLWILIHSGSRHFGAKVSSFSEKKALKLNEQYFSNLPNKDLAFLPTNTDEGEFYAKTMALGCDYAKLNRKAMLEVAQHFLAQQSKIADTSNIIDIHHNYAALEHHFGENVWIHRKGACLARDGTVGIIPGSMCTKSFIVKGKGEPDSYFSSSHGAGRRFSRTEAKKRVASGVDPSQSEQLGAVKLYGVREAHDELGSGYKDILSVMKDQEDLVDIVTELKTVAVLKG